MWKNRQPLLPLQECSIYIAFLSCNSRNLKKPRFLNKYLFFSRKHLWFSLETFLKESINELPISFLFSFSTTTGCDVKWLCNGSISISWTVIAGAWPLVLQANSDDGKSVSSWAISFVIEAYVTIWRSKIILAIMRFTLFSHVYPFKIWSSWCKGRF